MGKPLVIPGTHFNMPYTLPDAQPAT